MNRIIRFAAIAGFALTMAACGSKSDHKAADAASTEAVEETVAESVVAATDAPKAGVVNILPDGAALQPADKPIVIDFNAVWCGPCKMFAPVFEKAAADNADKFYFYSVDIDKCPDMAQKYEANAIPQVSILYPDGRIVNNEPGYMDEAQFAKLLENVK